VGAPVGISVGGDCIVGVFVGDRVGRIDGGLLFMVGCMVGDDDGLTVGSTEGNVVGLTKDE